MTSPFANQRLRLNVAARLVGFGNSVEHLFGAKHLLATAVFVSTRCIYWGIPNLKTPASINSHDYTPVEVSGPMRPSFSVNVMRATRSSTRTDVGKV